ncbi:MAG TPA: hypothetical protein VM802_15635 [Chitinophaga sp.]|uniref:hypothetical protein n=1 Tax=Chitinophaga sp. TaxID=1869181 RepID=UPI002BC1C689|nr:hypothetical protein [Chitinophaga sp.]HVI46307.1 hypothetical protein [Chitinophaga sp.]
MKLYLTLLGSLLLHFSTQAQHSINGLQSPESVVSYKNGYFVSNIGPKLEPLAKDGDGTIAWINGEKLVTLKYFDDTLNAPKGLDIIGDILYVADIDHLKGYDINSRKKVFDLNLEGQAGLLNDVNAANDSMVLISDTFKGNVLMVNVRGGSYEVLKGDVPAANGVLYDPKTDIVYLNTSGPNFDGNGKLYAKKLSDKEAAFTAVENSPTGLFDGIVLLDDNRIVLSDWITVKNPTSGRLVIYDLKTKQFTSMDVKHGAADIALDRKKHMLLLPLLPDNTLEIMPLAKIGH